MAFFTTPASVRVRSVTGGRSYSAAVTVDGRVFKWGLNRPARSSHGSKHSREGEGGEDRSNSPSEEDGEAAVEASVPRQVTGVGVEVRGCLIFVEPNAYGISLYRCTTAQTTRAAKLEMPCNRNYCCEGETHQRRETDDLHRLHTCLVQAITACFKQNDYYRTHEQCA